LSTPLTITYNPLPQLSLENISKHWKHSKGFTKYLLLKMWVKKLTCFNIVLNLKHELTRKYLCTSCTWNNIPLLAFAYLNRFLSTIDFFKVNVLVLSLQSTSIPTISSMVVMRFVIALYIQSKSFMIIKTTPTLESARPRCPCPYSCINLME
jgi:hypothetical protein